MITFISDIHGDKGRMLELLRQAGIVTPDDKWCGGESILGVLGDSTDRGNEGIDVLLFLHSLSEQAKEAGGQVFHLLGNHDAAILAIARLELEGLYDPTKIDVFTYNGGKMSEARYLAKHNILLNYVSSFSLMAIVGTCLCQHADGFEFYEKLIQRALHTTVQFDPASMIKAVNRLGKEELKSYKGAWNLFYDMTDARYLDGCKDYAEAYVNQFECKQMIHGHTGQKTDAPLTYCGGAVVNIDAMLSKGYRPNSPNRGCIYQVAGLTELII